MPGTAGWLKAALLHFPPGDERRAAPRHPSALQAACRLLGDDTPFLAQLTDVSALGVGLVLPGPSAPAGLLHIDFASGLCGAARAVLSRVVHITRRPSGWLVGCAFSRELDEAALRSFRAARVLAPDGDSRRWVRFRCDVEAVCYSVDTTPGERRPARVLDASAGGVGLLVPCEFSPGTLLRLDLPGEASQVMLRVVRAVPQPGGRWLLGCEFADWLTGQELAVLL